MADIRNQEDSGICGYSIGKVIYGSLSASEVTDTDHRDRVGVKLAIKVVTVPQGKEKGVWEHASRDNWD